MVFAGSLLGGSLLNQLQQLYLNPSSVVRIVGTSAPETAIFFCSYLLLQATVTKPIAFLRLPGEPLQDVGFKDQDWYSASHPCIHAKQQPQVCDRW